MSSISRDPFTVSPQKRALIEAKLREEGLLSANADAILPRPYRGLAPLSFAQQRLWFFDQFEPGSPLYNLVSPVLFEGDLDTGALEGAFNGLIERHEALRTTFDFRDGQPVQIVAPVQRLQMNQVDLANLDSREQLRKVESMVRQEAARPFDLKRGPLLRMTLLRLADRKHVLLLAVHHIVCDAWSTAIMIDELGTFYTAIRNGRPALLPELPIQYPDFAAWQRQWLQGAVLERQLEYWKAKLGDSLPVLELPADRPRPSTQTFNGSSVSFTVPSALLQSLKALAQSEKATLFMALLAAFKVLLSRYTGLEDITVGTPIANRQRQELEHLIGFFTNTLAIRSDLSGNPRFRDLLKAVRENLLDAYAHQDLPFEYLVEQLHPERSLSHSPLVQVMLVLRNTPDQQLKFPGVTATTLKSAVATAKFDLSLYLDETGDRIEGEIEYNTDLFERARIERMGSHFVVLLASIVRNPAESISDLRLLTDAENQQLLVKWNDTQIGYSRACVHELFEQQVERSPDSTALLFEQGSVTYAELNRRANKIARHLQALGAKPGTAVAILMERSPDMIASVLAILKTGAVCLPLNPSYPAQRLAFMLEDSGSLAVLSHRQFGSILSQMAASATYLDSPEIEQEDDRNIPLQVDIESGCYLIYTSGSTGTPKGVVMPHRALVNLVEWHRTTGSKSSRVLQFASLTFDVSFQEIFSTFVLGGTLVLLPESVRVDMRALGAFIGANRIERFHLPVVVLQKLAEEFCTNPQPLSSLRELMVGGEQLQITKPITRLFEQLSDCVLYNHYGPSETHVVTSYELPRSSVTWPSLPPLGRRVANVRAYVLDAHLRPVPVGVTGELYLGGDCLAHGYLKRPALTAERFIPDPFSSIPGARMYKTGDLVRCTASGDLEFIGRNDFQVKIRGMRIELPEVELALRQHPAVREAVVTVHQDGSVNEKRLAAYIVPHPGREVTAKQLRDFLRELLPEHMLPFHVTVLGSFPLTRSGKINRLALPAPEKHTEPGDDFVEPETPVQKALASIFAEVLGAHAVGVHDNFFDLGGHSLMATQIASRVRETFRIELPVRAIFEEPTVGGLARSILLDESNRGRIERTAELLSEFSVPASSRSGFFAAPEGTFNANANSSVMPVPNTGQLRTAATPIPAPKKIVKTAPLSFAQQRLWFLVQYDPQSTVYNLPAALRLKGQLNVGALERSLNEIVRRHESLRTTFDISSERPVQIIHEASPWKLPVTDLQTLPAERQRQVQDQLIAEEADRPFDLGRGPLLRAQLLRISPADHIFLVTMHHIVSDGWSMQLFVRELAALYDANCRNESIPLPELPMQYAEFASWQREWLQGAVLAEQLDYWKQQLADAPQLLEFPTDRPRPVYKTFRGAALLFEIPRALTQEIANLGRHEGTTLFMTLLASFYVLLYRYTDQEDIVVGTPIANRNRRDIEELIGFFVNTLVMRARLSGEMSVRQLLQRVRETCLQAYTHQDVPFEKLVEELHPERNLSHSPLFQAVFHLQNVLNEELHLAGLSVTAVQAEIKKAKFDLSLAVSETANGLTGILNYNTDLFEADTIRRIATHFHNLLESAVRNPDQRISCMQMLSAAEEEQLLVSWNAFKLDYGRDRLVHEIVQDQARLRPDAVAVRCENATMTYAELNRHANQLAHHLRKLGVGPEHVVGICMERSLEMMVGLFGILKAGAAYLPLDPEYPKARLAFMLDDASVEVVVTQKAVAEHLPQRREQRVYLDLNEWAPGNENPEAAPSMVQPENLAYVIYTSGSTGKPKGIMIEHRTLANYLGWASELMFDDAVETVPAVQALTFDGSLKQLFAPLLRGLEVWVLSKTEVRDPMTLIHALSAHRDVRFSAVPSLWKAILDALESGQAVLPAGAITRAFIGGEELPKAVVDRTFTLLPDLLLWNLYGPSEITATAAATLIRPGEQITLGKPIAGKKVHILDPQLQPVPIGVAGEIYVGREGLARGYVQRPDLTAANFIPDPFSDQPGARLYRTRDRARYLPDGRIEFLGRLDHQVKVRGFRVELGEIEAALREHSQVREAVAITRSGAAGEQQIVAYVVPPRESAPTVTELRTFLKDRVPEYMVPSAWVILDGLPLTANGKLNRAALPEPEWGKRDVASPLVTPRTALEQTIAEIFAEVLGIAQVSVYDNFFQLGGHSLLATRVVAQIRKKLKTELSLRQFFEGPTIAEVAEALTKHDSTPGRLEETAVLLQKIDRLSIDDLEELLRQKRAKEIR